MDQEIRAGGLIVEDLFFAGWLIFAGACFASFGMLAGDRWTPGTPLPVYLSKVCLTRSRCDACRADIAPFAVTPIVGWLIGGGWCQCLRTRISWTYLLGEMIGALFMAAAVMRYGDVMAAPLLFCIFGLAAAVRSDLATHEIHETAAAACAAGAIGFWIAGYMDYGGPVAGVTADALAGLVLFLLAVATMTVFVALGRIAFLPLGDVMLFAAIAPLLDTGRAMTFALILAPAALGLRALSSARAANEQKSVDREGAFPFAPAIAVAVAVALVLPPVAMMVVDAAIWRLA